MAISMITARQAELRFVIVTTIRIELNLIIKKHRATV